MKAFAVVGFATVGMVAAGTFASASPPGLMATPHPENLGHAIFVPDGERLGVCDASADGFGIRYHLQSVGVEDGGQVTAGKGKCVTKNYSFEEGEKVCIQVVAIDNDRELDSTRGAQVCGKA